jgi:hypothetical protein
LRLPVTRSVNITSISYRYCIYTLYYV